MFLDGVGEGVEDDVEFGELFFEGGGDGNVVKNGVYCDIG